MQAHTEISGVLSAGGILDRIVEAKCARLEAAKSAVPLHSITDRARAARLPGRSLTNALKHSDRVNIIAEIKKQSPSKGIIREDFDPSLIAESYERGGAAALSVLCEEDFFGGSLSHLATIRDRVDLPLLRKDFIFDEYQLFEAVLAGADAILLIVAILDNELLSRLIGLAREIGLDALVEVHTDSEMARAVDAGASTIGINNRDLKTFVVDLEVSYRLARLAPTGTLLVSESGINSIKDINYLQAAGFNGFLVGEHLMRSKDPGEALKDLLQSSDL